VEGAECRSGLDGLELLLDRRPSTTFAPALGGMGEHALHLARADHARLVDDEHVAR
jgi:hypothetical protein